MTPSPIKGGDNVFKTTIGGKNKLTLDDIAKCTGGGSTIGATISRNLNRLKMLSKGEGWITGSKIDKLLSDSEKTNDLQLKLKSELESIKHSDNKLDSLKPLKSNVKKIAKLSKILNPEDTKTVIEAENTAKALKSLSNLKKIDPMVLLHISNKYSKLDSTLVKDFSSFMRTQKPIPSTKEGVRSAYTEFLKSKSNFMYEETIDQTKLKTLEKYADNEIIRTITYIDESPEDGYKNKVNDVIKEFIKSTPSKRVTIIEPKDKTEELSQTSSTEESSIEEKPHNSIKNSPIYKSLETKFLNDLDLSEQVQMGINNGYQDRLFILNEKGAREEPVDLDYSMEDEISYMKDYTDFIPSAIKEFAGNDPEKIKMIGMLLTNNHEYLNNHMNEKHNLSGEANFIPYIYEFEVENGERRITMNTFVEMSDNGKPTKYATTTMINLDNPDAPIRINGQKMY